MGWGLGKGEDEGRKPQRNKSSVLVSRVLAHWY